MQLDRQRIIADMNSLMALVPATKVYTGEFKMNLPANFLDLLSIKVTQNPLTPTGKQPRYPFAVSIDLPERTFEPPDGSAWIDDYVAYHGGDIKTPADKRRKPWSPPDIDQGSFIGHMSYFPDLTIGKADFNFWQSKIVLQYAFRSKKGEIYISEIKRKHLDDENATVLYKYQ